jgi:hypothetical protein
MFSKIPLKLQNHPIGKMCSFARHTTFMKIGIADFECKGVKIAKQGAKLLCTDAEFLPEFPSNLCSNQ